jgi:hypothetical protein
MPATPTYKKRMRATAAFYASQKKQIDGRRGLCSYLKFWKYCGHKKCLRARTCAGEGCDCFGRLWPIVPEELKVIIRAAAKAFALSPAETKVAIERDLARWRALNKPPAEPAPPPAPELPQSAPILPAPTGPRATGPRLRVL